METAHSNGAVADSAGEPVVEWVLEDGYTSVAAAEEWVLEDGYTSVAAAEEWLLEDGYTSVAAAEEWLLEDDNASVAAAEGGTGIDECDESHTAEVQPCEEGIMQ